MTLDQEHPLREIVEALMRSSSPSRDDLARLKLSTAAKHQLSKVPSNSEIIQVLKVEERRKLLPILRRKDVRTISGITIVAVMTKPYPCPQSEPCAYCPGGPPFGVPQSYTGFEPAAMRGLQNEFDPHSQVTNRIKQLQAIGHTVDKVELIIMGGTFPATPREYQEWFTQRCLDAITEQGSSSLTQAKQNAETSRIRNVGITVETRPDWSKETHVDNMLNMGVTRVELGVQNPSDKIYRLVGRSHTVQDVVQATRTLKDAGIKVAYHLMPGLPSSNPELDIDAFKQVFSDPDFRPDMIKIYPCLVLKDTKAYKWYVEGEYEPYTDEEAANLIVEIKKIIPSWARIMRVQRDIPAQLIVAGVKSSNLRQLVSQRMKREGIACRCIRCREIGHRTLKDEATLEPERVKILTTEYPASEGTEIFISAEDPENQLLVGYLRLRKPSDRAHRSEVATESSAMVRELRVYGPLVPVGRHEGKAWQHKGYGNMLLTEAERLSKERFDARVVLVISALGTKQYYKRQGYDYHGSYMSKRLES